jgi:Xaa-Pro aminopeptidase
MEVLKKGMAVSNEPGYYEDGNFGIRIENLLEITYIKPEHNDDSTNGDDANDKKFLKFEKLTLIPIQKNLINVNIMMNEELDWLDSYHGLIMEKVSHLLEPKSRAMTWLEKSCAKIKQN